MDRLIADLESNPNIFLSKQSLLKLKRILEDGAHKLHIIADFDMTLTKNYIFNAKSSCWERNISAHGMFMRYSKASDKFKRETQSLCDIYYPMEVDQLLTEQEKIPHMVKWWQGAHDLIKEMGFTRRQITEMVQENPVEFREGTEKLFSICEKSRIPVLIFSAGIANVIEEILKRRNLAQNYQLFHILSNRMLFESESVDAKVVGFSEPLLHVFNKSESILYEQDAFKTYSKQVATRPNVILIGDSLGDIRMGKGMKHGCELSIGLLNKFECKRLFGDKDVFNDDAADFSKVEIKSKLISQLSQEAMNSHRELLRSYCDVFDIVITGDVDFDQYLNRILMNLTSQP